MKIAIGLLLSCCLAACSAHDNSPEPGALKIYRGLYLYAFEASIFLPDDVPELWWVSDVPSLREGIEPEDLPGIGRTYIQRLVVDATVTEKGFWGHVGTGERELTVARMIERQPATWNEFELASCKLPPKEWHTDQDKLAMQAHCDEVRRQSR